LRTDARESRLTLREYVGYLHRAFLRYNLRADRRDRLTADMIAARINPSPAGLWRFGHQACIGYEKFVPREQLASALLYRTSMSVCRDGNYVESLEYEGDLAVQRSWSTIARQEGSFERTAFMYPGSSSRLWVPDDQGLFEFRLRANARALPDTTLEEWRDSLAYSSLDLADLQYQRLRADMERAAIDKAMIKAADAATKEAEAKELGKRPSVREARERERRLSLPADVATATLPAQAEDTTVAAATQAYERAMDACFARLNRGSPT
jgi:putative transposase